MEYIDIYFYKLTPLNGSSYIVPLFKSNNNIVNIQNEDNECFVWSILAKIHYDDIKGHRQRVSQYKKYRHEINTDGIEMSFKVKDLDKFHEQNPDISVSIFILRDQSDLKTICPLRPFTEKLRTHHVDLLLIYNEKNSHYILIKNLNALLCKQKHKRYICRNCNISSFTSKSALDNHLIKCGNAMNRTEVVEEVNSRFHCNNCLNKSYKSEKDLLIHKLSCLENKPFKVEMPNKYNNILKFNKHYMESEIPFRIYCDFETVNVKDNDQKFKQKPSGYSIVLVSDFQDIIPNRIIQRRGKSCEETLQMYINDIKNLQSICYNKLRINRKMIPLSAEQRDLYNKATNCDWCKKEFNDDYFCNKCYEKVNNPEDTCHEKKYSHHMSRKEINEEEEETVEKNCKKCDKNKNDINSCHDIKPIQSNKKVCHHNHYSGEFKNFLCTRCNLIEGYKTKFVPVYFHNLCGYDSHLFIKELISNLFVRNNLKDLKKQLKKNPQDGDLRIQISTLENEIKSTPKFKVLSKTTEEIIALDYGCLRFLDSMKFFQDSLEKVAESLSSEDFKLTHRHTVDDEEKVRLLTKKGIYPYDYIDSFDRFNETDLPSKDKFFSRLRKSGITEKEYLRAKLIWNKFNCKNLGEYSDLYCLSDTLILADCFEKFRKFFINNHKIDPCHSYSTPGLTWEVGLKFTGVNLELLTDYDMYLMFEQGRRGGFSGVLGSRKVIANNKFLSNYDS